MSSYILSSAAARDLEEIWDFIAADSMDSADRWIDKLFDCFDLLGKNPALGHKREDLTAHPVLFWPVGSYLVIYRAQRSRIEIVAVTRGGRDIPVFLTPRVS